MGGAVGCTVGAAVAGWVGAAIEVTSGWVDSGVAVALGVEPATVGAVLEGGVAVAPATPMRTTNTVTTPVTIPLALTPHPGLLVHMR